MRKIIVITITWLLAMSISCPVYSQAPGSQAQGPEDEVIQDAAISDERGGVRQDVQRFLNKKGWSEGENYKKDGSKFFISYGISAISAPRTHKKYISARVNAFDKAILLAKQKMVDYMGSEIEVEAKNDYIEGDFDAAEKRAQKIETSKTSPGILDKTKLLVHNYLDKELQKEGIDPKSEEAKEEIKKIVSSESFSKVTKTLGNARIVGMQMYKTFETLIDGVRGEVAVLCIQSDKLRQIAEAIYTDVAPPKGRAKRPIMQQIPTDTRVLLCSYGVQTKKDENGNTVLVAFAQAQPATKSKRSENAAYRKAKTLAMGLIRQFAGENAHVSTAIKQAEESKEFEDETLDYTNDEAYKEQVSTYAKALNISGISVKKEWKGTHPLIKGSVVVGVVCTWSPGASVRAKAMKGKMEAAPSSAQDQQSQPTTLKIGEGQEGSFSGAGAEGDEDSF